MPDSPEHTPLAAMRLNRFLASCGVASRRACDSLIQNGAVTINGLLVREPATSVSADDLVVVNGVRVKPKPPVCILLHKPRGLTTTKKDEQEKETIYECLPPKMHHLHHAGRLDRDSEGLLVLTNDGELSRRLTHPSLKLEKEYLVTLHEGVTVEQMDRLLGGVRLTEGQVRFKAMLRVSTRRVHVIIEQGLKRQIRRMFATMGLKVTKLVRIRIGSLWLDDTPPGRWRHLSPDEIQLMLTNPKKLPSAEYHRIVSKVERKNNTQVTKTAAEKRTKRLASLRGPLKKRSLKRQVKRRR